MIVPVTERTVSDSLQEKLGVAREKEFPPGGDPGTGQGRGLRLGFRSRHFREQRDRDGAHSRS
ncbi:MAG: hypothetical protein EBT68_01390 [Verrucomicrobia bacterium]|nr:hypothetical protein [Verrucomicrobiota bacterium]